MSNPKGPITFQAQMEAGRAEMEAARQRMKDRDREDARNMVSFVATMPATPGGPAGEMVMSFVDVQKRDEFRNAFLERARTIATAEGLALSDIEKMLKITGNDPEIRFQPPAMKEGAGFVMSAGGEPTLNFGSKALRNAFMELAGLKGLGEKPRITETKPKPDWDKKVFDDYKYLVHAPGKERSDGNLQFNPHVLSSREGLKDIHLDPSLNAPKEQPHMKL